jgi:hypothetical protein
MYAMGIEQFPGSQRVPAVRAESHLASQLRDTLFLYYFLTISPTKRSLMVNGSREEPVDGQLKPLWKDGSM